MEVGRNILPPLRNHIPARSRRGAGICGMQLSPRTIALVTCCCIAAAAPAVQGGGRPASAGGGDRVAIDRVAILKTDDVAGSAGRPHIMFHVVDDLGWNDLGYQRGALPGQENAMRSTHLDELALGGVRLHDYAVFKFCSPSRSQFLTGRYAYHLGQQTVINLPSSGPTSSSTAPPLGCDSLLHGCTSLLCPPPNQVSRT